MDRHRPGSRLSISGISAGLPGPLVRALRSLLEMLGGRSGFFVKFPGVPPRSILFQKVIKHQKRLGLPAPLLPQTELAFSMMLVGIPTGRVVLQQAMQISEHNDKIVRRLVPPCLCIRLGSKQTHFRSIRGSKEHRFYSRGYPLISRRRSNHAEPSSLE